MSDEAVPSGCGRLECVVREAAPAVCHWVSCGGGGGWLGAASATGAAFCVVGALVCWEPHCIYTPQDGTYTVWRKLTRQFIYRTRYSGTSGLHLLTSRSLQSDSNLQSCSPDHCPHMFAPSHSAAAAAAASYGRGRERPFALTLPLSSPSRWDGCTAWPATAPQPS